MTISAVRVRRLAIDSEPWYGRPPTAREQRSFQFPLIEVEDDSGEVGYATGYCPLGQGRGNAQQLADVYPRLLVGRDVDDLPAIWRELRDLHRHLYTMTETGLGQIDVALWDLKGKLLGRSIADLLGRTRDRIAAYGTGFYFLPTPEATAAEAVRIRDAGFAGAKFNMFGGPAVDIPKLRAAREAVGDDFPLMLDASSHLSYGDALVIGRAIGELDFRWFEEPLFDRQLGRLAELRRRLDVPLLGAETVSLFELGEVVRTGVFDLVRGDVYAKAGITGLTSAIGMCDVLGVPLELHACSSPLLDVANLHVACATRSTDWLESHHPMFRFGLVGDPFELGDDGMLHCPTGPGLGVELDRDWIDDHTVETVTPDPMA